MDTLSWSTLEFEKKERHPDWLWTAGLVFAIGAVLAFFYRDIFFGIFLVLAGIVLIIYAVQEPKMLSITLGDDGISINDTLLPYKQIKHFWLDETAKQDKLLLLVSGTFVPVIGLPLEGVTAEAVRTRLLSHLKQEEIRESASIKIFEHLGF